MDFDIDFTHPIFYLTAFIFGACIGSFLNVAIYRIPLGLSVNNPKRSFCPHCKTEIPAYDNLPILSWFILRGKCATCHYPISPRYWIVELFTAVIFVFLYHLAPGLSSPFLFLWGALAIVVGFIDAETLNVYPRQTLAATVAACCAIYFSPQLLQEETGIEALKQSGLGILVGFLIIELIILIGKLALGKVHYQFKIPTKWYLKDAQDETDEVTLHLGELSLGWSYLFTRNSDKVTLKQTTVQIDQSPTYTGTVILQANLLTCITPDGKSQSFPLDQVSSVSGTTQEAHIPREAMGKGDAYIMMMICALTGVQSILFILLIASIIGLLQAFFLKLKNGARLPFGPLLLISTLFWLIYGHNLWEQYLSLIK